MLNAFIPLSGMCAQNFQPTTYFSTRDGGDRSFDQFYYRSYSFLFAIYYILNHSFRGHFIFGFYRTTDEFYQDNYYDLGCACKMCKCELIIKLFLHYVIQRSVCINQQLQHYFYSKKKKKSNSCGFFHLLSLGVGGK